MTHTRGHRARRRSTRRRGGDDPGISRAQRAARLGAPSVPDASIKSVPGEVPDTSSPLSLFKGQDAIAAQNAVADAMFGPGAEVRNQFSSPEALKKQVEELDRKIASLETRIEAETERVNNRTTGRKGSMLRGSLKEELAELQAARDKLAAGLPKAGRRKKTLRKMPRGLVVQRICAVVVRPIGSKKGLGTRRRR